MCAAISREAPAGNVLRTRAADVRILIVPSDEEQSKETRLRNRSRVFLLARERPKAPLCKGSCQKSMIFD